MMERYSNKRNLHRKGGKFYRPTASDFGIGGACPNCQHLLIHVYDGDANDPHPHPLKFRYRCFHCEPKTEKEIEIEAAIEATKPKRTTFADLFKIGTGE